MANSSNVWDLPGQGFRSGMPSTGMNNSNYIWTSPYGNNSMVSTPLGRVPIAPPLPPRPVQNSYMSNTYNPHGSYFNNYVNGGYGGSGYGFGYRPGFSPYGYGYGPVGNYGGNNPESRFIQIAEESLRPTFDSIQSVLHGFHSITSMFDSTFSALYTSYMSVIGVADYFGRLRSVVTQIFSALALFRTLHWLYRHALYKLGISKLDPNESWVGEFKKLSGVSDDPKQKNPKPWSAMLLLSIIMAGPYLLFKLMSHMYPTPQKEVWNPIVNPGSLAVGAYDFHSVNDRELNFTANQKLMIAPAQFQPVDAPGWVLACDGNKRIGLVPGNYISMVVQSEKTGQTYVNRGEGYQPVSTFGEGTSKQCGVGQSTILTEEGEKGDKDKTTDKATE